MDEPLDMNRLGKGRKGPWDKEYEALHNTSVPMDDDMVSNLYEATFFTCSKCKENKNNLPENAQILLCSECSHNYKLMHLKKTMENKTMEPEPQIEALEA